MVIHMYLLDGLGSWLGVGSQYGYSYVSAWDVLGSWLRVGSQYVGVH